MNTAIQYLGKNMQKTISILAAFPFILLLYIISSAQSPSSPSASVTQGATRQYAGTPKTIAHDFLDIEKESGVGSDQYAAIDTLINKAMAKITEKKSYTTEEAIQTLLAIDSVLAAQGFTFKNNFLLGKGLEYKKIDCDNYCVLYVAIAEVLKIPIIPVYAPNHSFLRFFFDDGTYINWEVLEKKIQPDSYYIQKLKIPDSSIRAGVYMKSLTRQEFIAVEYNNIGAYLLISRKYAPAIPIFSASIRYNPQFSTAYHNRGSSYYAVRRLDEALSDLLKADELDPSRASTHNTLGDIYLDRKEYDKALYEFTASIKLDPANYVPYNNIAVIMKVLGNEDSSQKWLKKSREIKERHGK